MVMRHLILFTLTLSFLLLTACSRRPNYVLSEEEMTNVLYDIQLAQAIFRMNNDFTSDDKKDQVIEGVLKKHDISQAELDSSLLWYSDNIKIYVDINEKVAERLKADYDTLEVRRNHLMKNIRDWSNYIIPPYFHLTESSPLFSFTIDSVKRKTLDLNNFNIVFDVQGMNKNQNVEAAVYYTYRDSLIRNTYSLNENTRFVLKKPELADSLLKEVSGYIHMKNKIKGQPSDILFYNVSYSDSTSSTLEGDILSIPKESLTSKENVSDRTVNGSVNNTSGREKGTKTKTPNGSDDVPVLSKDDIESSPLKKRSRNTD